MYDLVYQHPQIRRYTTNLSILKYRIKTLLEPISLPGTRDGFGLVRFINTWVHFLSEMDQRRPATANSAPTSY
ncbi:MAG: hypothetical protein WBM55_04770 [Muriicola sp.]